MPETGSVGRGKERRRAERLGVKDGMYVVFRPSFTPLGRVVNISEEGISLDYVPLELQCSPLDESSSAEIDLFTLAGKFYIKRIPCKVSYDILHEPDSEGFPNSTVTRRCGLEFCELSESQKTQLEHFVNGNGEDKYKLMRKSK